jgi:hypothetical protein
VVSCVGFGAELDGVFVGPWHQEALGERHIEVHEAGSAEIISGADLSAERIRESRFGGSGIGKQLNLSVVVMNVDRESGAGSHLYRGAVKDETDRKGPGICAEKRIRNGR